VTENKRRDERTDGQQRCVKPQTRYLERRLNNALNLF